MDSQITPLKTQSVPEDTPSLPHNIDAEQALLGGLLHNNAVHDRVGDFLLATHFYDPVHGRIYDIATKLIANGNLANAVSLRTYLEHDSGLNELGGASYIARLITHATGISNAKHYAQIIYDLFIRRCLVTLGEDMVHDAMAADLDTPPGTQIETAEQSLFNLAEKGTQTGGFMSFTQSLTGAVDMAKRAYERDGHLSGIATGFSDMDDILGGLQKSDLLILAGRPSMGKTSLATNIAFSIAQNYINAKKAGRFEEKENGRIEVKDGGIVGFFSLEMSAEQLAMRILSEQARISSSEMRKGILEENEFNRLVTTSQNLHDMPLYIDHTGAIPMATLAARARRLKRQYGLDVLVIDYLQLIVGTTNARGSENRVQEISYITQSLKALAKELDIPIIALSQLSRQVEQRDNKRPQLADLRESGSIEQDADVVLFVYRQSYYLKKEEPDAGTDAYLKWQEDMNSAHGKAEIIIGKNRHGPVSTINLTFEEKFTKFGNMPKTIDDDHLPQQTI